uniref:Uncharacterized protein n=1 Tax=Timema tahoe TaxID=61484 RepID=A0A7R9IKC8_9NEOP|nr:unnamed protein product [Timema tahoe]
MESSKSAEKEGHEEGEARKHTMSVSSFSGVELSSCRRQGLGGGRVRGDVRELSHLPLPPHPCRPSLASHCLPLGSSARAKSPGSEDREFVRRLILKAETVSNLAMPTHHHDGEMSEDELEKKRMLLLQELQKQD